VRTYVSYAMLGMDMCVRVPGGCPDIHIDIHTKYVYIIFIIKYRKGLF